MSSSIRQLDKTNSMWRRQEEHGLEACLEDEINAEAFRTWLATENGRKIWNMCFLSPDELSKLESEQVGRRAESGSNPAGEVHSVATTGPRRSARLQAKATTASATKSKLGSLSSSNNRQGSVRKASPTRKAKAIKELASTKLVELRRSTRLAKKQSATTSERTVVVHESRPCKAASDSKKRSASTAFLEEAGTPAARPVKRRVKACTFAV